MKRLAVALLLVAWLAGPALANDMIPSPEDMAPPPDTYSPFVGDTYPKDVYWGDTHLHTSNSFDAGFVNDKVGPEEAFRFARGEAVLTTGGMQAQLVRPLDFLVVSDHAEYLGLTPALRESNPLLLQEEAGRRWHAAIQSGEFGRSSSCNSS